MTLVVDSSVVVAGLIDQGSDGYWARALMATEDLVVPQHMLIESTNILRRSELRKEISPETALVAYTDLLLIQAEIQPFLPFASRIWQLRNTLTAYDAWYVAIAETLDLSLATLDQRLARAPGPRCAFLTPDN